MAAEAGQLQLNAFEPVMAACIFEGQTLLVNAANTLRKFCVEGITANKDVLKHYMESSIGTVTALNPVIGYDKATELAAEALKTGEGILELVREKHILTDAQIDEILESRGADGLGTVGSARRPVMALPLRRPAPDESQSTAPATTPAPKPDAEQPKPKRLARAMTLAIALTIWFIPPPGGLTAQAWHLFAIFAATILSVVIGAFPILTASVLRRRGRGPHGNAVRRRRVRWVRESDDRAHHRRVSRRARRREVRTRPATRISRDQSVREIDARALVQHLRRRRTDLAGLSEQHGAIGRALSARVLDGRSGGRDSRARGSTSASASS